MPQDGWPVFLVLCGLWLGACLTLLKGGIRGWSSEEISLFFEGQKTTGVVAKVAGEVLIVLALVLFAGFIWFVGAMLEW